MNLPAWLKPGLFGVAVGAAALAILGFTWGGWVGEMKAQRMAADQAREEVVAALLPVCIEQSKKDPEYTRILAVLKDTRSYERSNKLMESGWATMPGTTEPNRYVANACMDQLAAEF